MNEQREIGRRIRDMIDAEFSLGFSAHIRRRHADEIADVVRDRRRQKRGCSRNELVAVNGRKWTPDILREAIVRRRTKEPIELLWRR